MSDLEFEKDNGDDTHGQGAHRSAWLGVELRHLAALAAIDRERSFRAAAQSLGYVQSAVSQQIAYLERLVGTQLVERRRGSQAARLTGAGRVLVSHVDQIQARFEAARVDVESFLEEGHARIGLGVPSGLPAPLLPAILQDFATRHPRAGVVPTEAREADLLLAVRDGTVDFTLGDLPAPSGPFAVVELMRVRCVLLVAPDSPWADVDRPVTREQLAALPLLAAVPENHLVDVGLTVGADRATPATAAAFARAGLGVALVSRCDASDAQDLERIELDPSVPSRRLGLFWHRDRLLDDLRAGFRHAAERAGRLLEGAAGIERMAA